MVLFDFQDRCGVVCFEGKLIILDKRLWVEGYRCVSL